MSARRVELVQGGRGVPCCETRLDTHVFGKLLGTKQLQHAKETMRIVFEWRRAQEQDVTSESGDRRDRSPAGIARVAWRASQSLRFIHDEQIDSCAHGLIGQLRSLDQHLEGDDPTTMDVEGIEGGTKVARHVGQPLRVEEREHLVVLPPELTQPLHGQGLWNNDETAIDLPRVHQPIQDQRGLDGFSETDFVGEQPPHRIAGAGTLGDVQLVREEPDASTQEGAEAIGLA